MNISVFGLGYVGTVTAACLADQGHQLWGIDINPQKVALINTGKSPVVETGLVEKLERGVKTGRLRATTDAKEALIHSEVSFVVVATPSGPNGEISPDYLYRACEQIARSLKELNRKQVVVIRSTVLPDIFNGCQAVFKEQAPGLVDLCTNPEFLREGNAIDDFENPPFTLIGTSSPQAEASLREIFSGIKAPVHVLSTLEAVMVKYASNAYHGLKVTFANEIGALCKAQGINSHAVMSVFVQDTKLNISGRYLQPGFAFGGSCLPKDIRAILSVGQQYNIPTPLILSILPSNDQILERAFKTIVGQKKSKIGLIGLSFKANSDDLRESPFVYLVHRLSELGNMSLRVYDPNVAHSLKNQVGRATIEKVLPNIADLLTDSLDELLDHSHVLIVGHPYSELNRKLVKIDPSTIILDFGHVPELKDFKGTYNGINW